MFIGQLYPPKVNECQDKLFIVRTFILAIKNSYRELDYKCINIVNVFTGFDTRGKL